MDDEWNRGVGRVEVIVNAGTNLREGRSYQADNKTRTIMCAVAEYTGKNILV